MGDLSRALVNLTFDEVLAANDTSLEGLDFATTFSAVGADRVRYQLALAHREDTFFARLEATEAGAEPTADETTTETAQAETAAAERDDPGARAEKITARHRGWTYLIPKYTFERLDKSLADLLAAEKE